VRRLVATAALFASTSTLLCCALPALFVALGAGSVFAGLVSHVPQLIWLSEHKAVTFGVAALLLGAGAVLQWRARQLACPTDPQLAEACRTTRSGTGPVLWIAVALFTAGALFAFVPPLLERA
jgi:hypothetical protein